MPPADEALTADDPLDIKGRSASVQRHIVALGPIAVLSAQVEWQARYLLGFAIGTDDLDVVDALFLGDDSHDSAAVGVLGISATQRDKSVDDGEF